MNQDQQYLQLLKLVEENPGMSQRQLAARMGVSLGKVNYCLRALLARGLVKFDKFRQSSNKRQYAYLLTPAGIEEKSRIILSFIRRKEAEYEAIRRDIAALRRQLPNP
jgi:MarR family transcriptional regulator, temperature-dependent positive regulator of motility